MEKDIEALTRVLTDNLEITRALSRRIELLEQSREEDAARQMAVMLLLQAVVHSSPNREAIVALAERMAAQFQAQPAVVLHGGSGMFHRMKAHLDSMTGALPPSA